MRHPSLTGLAVAATAVLVLTFTRPWPLPTTIWEALAIIAAGFGLYLLAVAGVVYALTVPALNFYQRRAA